MALKQTFALALAFCALVALNGFAEAETTSWDLVKDFRISNTVQDNPRGPWSYLGDVTLLDVPQVGPQVYAWSNGGVQPYIKYIARNITKQNITVNSIILPPDYLDLDPQIGYLTLIWRAPQAGNYMITGNFLGIDTSETSHYVQICVSGDQAPVFSANISSYGQQEQFSFLVTLAKSQAVEFQVLTGSQYNDLSTGLAGQIVLSP